MEVSRTAVIVLTGRYRISGFIDLIPGARLTDYITSAKTFFAMTEVVVEDIRSGGAIFRSWSVNVSRDCVELIMPGDA